MSESDGIEEALEGTVRVAITAAAHLGERLARAREQALSQARAVSEQQARAYAARLHAERETARADLAPVHRQDWWAGADPQAIAKAYTTAHAWEYQDPDAFKAATKIRTEVRDRYGVDVDNTGADPSAVAAAVARSDELRGRSDDERRAARQDLAEAQVLMSVADREDRAAEQARSAAAEYEPEPSDLHRFTVTDGVGGKEPWAVHWNPNTGRLVAEWVDATAYAADHAEEFGSVEALDDRTGRQVPPHVKEQLTSDMGRAAHEVRVTAGGAYDSAERRQGFADELKSQGIDEAHIATRMRADLSQAKPATEATRPSAAKSPAGGRRQSGQAKDLHRARNGR